MNRESNSDLGIIQQQLPVKDTVPSLSHNQSTYLPSQHLIQKNLDKFSNVSPSHKILGLQSHIRLQQQQSIINNSLQQS